MCIFFSSFEWLPALVHLHFVSLPDFWMWETSLGSSILDCTSRYFAIQLTLVYLQCLVYVRSTAGARVYFPNSPSGSEDGWSKFYISRETICAAAGLVVYIKQRVRFHRPTKLYVLLLWYCMFLVFHTYLINVKLSRF